VADMLATAPACVDVLRCACRRPDACEEDEGLPRGERARRCLRVAVTRCMLPCAVVHAMHASDVEGTCRPTSSSV
jgi:hypothetical protein